MGRYQVELEDGSLYEVETDEAPKKEVSAKPFLPGFQRTEELISKRPDVLSEALSAGMERYKSLGKFLQDPLGAQASMGVLGGLFQRGEAAIANPLMLLQEEGLAKTTPGEIDFLLSEGVITEKEAEKMSQVENLRGASIRDLLGESIKGLTGKRMGQLGDIPRKIGVPEPFSSAIGLFSVIGITNVATRGKLVSSARKGGEFAKTKIPKIMGKNYTLNRAKLAADGMDDLYGGLSKEYDNLLDKAGNKMVDLKKAQDVIGRLPEKIVNMIKRDRVVTRFKDGTIHPILKNLKRMREVIRKSVPKKVWNGKAIADTEQHFLKEAYHDLGNIMAEGSDDLVRLNARYKSFMQMRDTLGRVLYDADGNVKAKGLENMFKPGAERVRQVFFERFAQQWPKAQQIIKDVVKFNKRQVFKQRVGKGAWWLGVGGAGGVGGYFGARSLLNQLVGEGGGGAGERR